MLIIYLFLEPRLLRIFFFIIIILYCQTELYDIADGFSDFCTYI